MSRVFVLCATVWLVSTAHAQDDGSGEPGAARSEVAEEKGAAEEENDTRPAPETTEPDEAAREADMFGGGEGGAETEGEPAEQGRDAAGAAPRTRDDEILGKQASVADIVSRLAETNDTLEFGGLAYLRHDSTVLDEGGVENSSLSSPSFIDVYGDARPSERVRFFVRGRLRHDATKVEDKTSVELDQAWIKFDLGLSAFITVGKQRIKWGTGRFWNPTDYLNTETLNPLSVTTLDERLGVNLFKVHVPVESIGANLYALGTFDDASSVEAVGGALRAEFVVGTSEISASLVARRHTPTRMGVDYSVAVGPVDLKLEVGVQRGVKTPFFRGQLDASPLSIDEFDLEGVAPEDIEDAVREQIPAVLAARQPERYSRKDDFIPQAVAGLEYGFNYTEEDAAYVGAEYFFNDFGYGGSELYPVLFQEGVFRPFYAGRHYAAVYAFLPDPGSWNDSSFTLSALGNLSDTSFIARLDYSHQILTYLTFNAYVMGFLGEQGEFNYGYQQDPLLDDALLPLVPEEFRADIPPEALEEIRIVGPALSVGVGLRMQL